VKVDSGDAVSDVLTDVLNTLQSKGRVFCYSKFTAPWAIRMKARNCAHFHFFERGQGWVELEEPRSATSIAAVEMVILPHGGAHILRDNRKAKAVDVDRLLEYSDDHIRRHEGGGTIRESYDQSMNIAFSTFRKVRSARQINNSTNFALQNAQLRQSLFNRLLTRFLCPAHQKEYARP